MKRYDVLLFDVDDTLLDFSQSEKIAVKKVMEHYHIPPSEENCRLYHQINASYWKLFEQNKIEKPKLLLKRFEDFFIQLGKKDICPQEINQLYFSYLKELSILLPGALELVKKACQMYPLYVVTNGTTIIQERRMELSPLKNYFKKIYISEQIGVQKPEKAFFDYVFQDLNITNPKRVLLLGDSPTSDILGGIRAGIDTCWYNPHYQNATLPSTYEIHELSEFEKIIEY